jgi:endonuclease YncB( thermonuclease family)
MRHAEILASLLLGVATVLLFLWLAFMPSGSEENRLANRPAQSTKSPIPTERPQAARLPEQTHPVPGPATSDRHLLAREKAEADRLAELQKKDENIVEFKPKPTTKIYYRVTVPDSGTLQAGDVVIKLNGIVARKADAQCQDEKGKSWPCGAAAKAALRRLVRARAVVCDLPEAGEQKTFTAHCAVSGTDLSTWMVRQGWAKPNDPPEPVLAEAARAAKAERIGFWRGAE